MKYLLISMTYGNKKAEVSVLPENRKTVEATIKVATPLMLKRLGL